MHAHRNATRSRSPCQRLRAALLVERMSAFVNGRHHGRLDEARIGMHREPHIKGAADARCEWMWRDRDSAAHEVITHAAQQLLTQSDLLFGIEIPFQRSEEHTSELQS